MTTGGRADLRHRLRHECEQFVVAALFSCCSSLGQLLISEFIFALMTGDAGQANGTFSDSRVDPERTVGVASLFPERGAALQFVRVMQMSGKCPDRVREV